jgi:hypothetical protein
MQLKEWLTCGSAIDRQKIRFGYGLFGSDCADRLQLDRKAFVKLPQEQ